jgi:hypothetical protein
LRLALLLSLLALTLLLSVEVTAVALLWLSPPLPGVSLVTGVQAE